MNYGKMAYLITQDLSKRISRISQSERLGSIVYTDSNFLAGSGYKVRLHFTLPRAAAVQINIKFISTVCTISVLLDGFAAATITSGGDCTLNVPEGEHIFDFILSGDNTQIEGVSISCFGNGIKAIDGVFRFVGAKYNQNIVIAKNTDGNLSITDGNQNKIFELNEYGKFDVMYLGDRLLVFVINKKRQLLMLDINCTDKVCRATRHISENVLAVAVTTTVQSDIDGMICYAKGGRAYTREMIGDNLKEERELSLNVGSVQDIAFAKLSELPVLLVRSGSKVVSAYFFKNDFPYYSNSKLSLKITTTKAESNNV